MPRPVFEVETQFTADTRPMEESMRRMEQTVKRSSQKMDADAKKAGKSLEQAFNLGKLMLGVRIAGAAIGAMGAIVDTFSGDLEKARLAMDKFS